MESGLRRLNLFLRAGTRFQAPAPTDPGMIVKGALLTDNSTVVLVYTGDIDSKMFIVRLVYKAAMAWSTLEKEATLKMGGVAQHPYPVLLEES